MPVMRTLAPLCILGCVLVCPENAGAIYGGSAVPAARWEAAVRLQWRVGRHSGGCSGVLITPRAVLTAAHCVRAPSGKRRRVRTVRIGNPRGRTVRARVASVHVPPGYDPRRPHAGHDLAVLILKRAVTGRKPIRIARPGDDPKRQGTKLTIAGFGVGRTRRGRLTRAGKLREIVQEYLPYACFRGPVKKMAKTRFCSAYPGRAVCPGDSGAPATLRRPGKPEIVVGIVSVALDLKVCSRSATTATRVSAFSAWIDKVTGARPSSAAKRPGSKSSLAVPGHKHRSR
jgi:secreted trypsin-like serine protease